MKLTFDEIMSDEHRNEQDTQLNSILSVMGLDHEVEQVRMYCEDHLVALRILAEAGSSYLNAGKDMLKDDPDPLIVNELNHIPSKS
ncbi:hypothetical protein [Paenibacillus paeoniae]|nr:hypothetical protein [Paenibacillus paeoniae]